MHYPHRMAALLAAVLLQGGPVHADDAARVSAPPASLRLPAYYGKYIDASGVPIVAAASVDDAALLKLKTIVDTMLQKDAATREQVVARLRRVLIIPRDAGMTSLPEYARLDQSDPLPGSNWNARAQGVGWTEAIPYASCSEANLLHAGKPQDRYPAESICIHELAHSVYDAGIVHRDGDALARLTALYQADLKRGFLANSYAGSSVSEYWAEGVQAWFNAANCAKPANTPTCSQTALYQNDYPQWNEIGHWFLAPYQLTVTLYP